MEEPNGREATKAAVRVEEVEPLLGGSYLISATVNDKPCCGVLTEASADEVDHIISRGAQENKRLHRRLQGARFIARRDRSGSCSSEDDNADVPDYMDEDGDADEQNMSDAGATTSGGRRRSSRRRAASRRAQGRIINSRTRDGVLEYCIKLSGQRRRWQYASKVPQALIRKFQQSQRAMRRSRRGSGQRSAPFVADDGALTDSSVDMPAGSLWHAMSRQHDLDADLGIEQPEFQRRERIVVGEYEPERILEDKLAKRGSTKFLFRVKWKGFPEEESTWEPEEHLPVGLVQQYELQKEETILRLRKRVHGTPSGEPLSLRVTPLKKPTSLPVNVFSNVPVLKEQVAGRKDYNLRRRGAEESGGAGGAFWARIQKFVMGKEEQAASAPGTAGAHSSKSGGDNDNNRSSSSQTTVVRAVPMKAIAPRASSSTTSHGHGAADASSTGSKDAAATAAVPPQQRHPENNHVHRDNGEGTASRSVTAVYAGAPRPQHSIPAKDDSGEESGETLEDDDNNDAAIKEHEQTHEQRRHLIISDSDDDEDEDDDDIDDVVGDDTQAQ